MDLSAYLVHAATRQMAESDAIEEQFAEVDAAITRAEAEAGARTRSGPGLAPRLSPVHALAGVLKECTVPQARSSEPPMRETKAGHPAWLACATGPDLTDWRRVGTALGQAVLPVKKRPDAVDARVAARHGRAVISTSDPEDLLAYPAVLRPQDVHVVPV
ncbi:hypothetical protein [Streptomyces sp. NPDC017448]|uniref:hypothetical protein n=1 Tax=Streptomyces sp. NPDC017448 TaxID=3364996 RepID=UPI0037B8861D